MRRTTRKRIDGLRERVLNVRSQLDGLRWGGSEELSPPDPETGERWRSANVLGHLYEALPFWTAQVHAVLEGAVETGRGASGYARRREGIETGNSVPTQELTSRVGGAVDGLLGLLAGMQDADLSREITHRARSGERKMRLGELIEELLVGHLEEHARQLDEIVASS